MAPEGFCIALVGHWLAFMMFTENGAVCVRHDLVLFGCTQ